MKIPLIFCLFLYNTNNERCLGEVVAKETLTFEDFLCYSNHTDYEVAYNPVFQDIFSEQYETAELESDYVYNEYMADMLHAGEFDHEMHKPMLEFLSAGLDIVSFGLKPLVEAFVGVDLLTGEQMTGVERFLSAVEGIIGLITFGSIWSKLGVMGIEGVMAELAKEVVTDSVSTMTSEGLEEMGASGLVSTAAGLASGSLTSLSADDLLNTKLWSSQMEVPEVPEERFRIAVDIESNETVDDLYETIFESQREVCIEYEDYLSEIRGLESESDICNVSLLGEMSEEEAVWYMNFLENGSTGGLRDVEIAGIYHVDEALALEHVDYDEVLEIRRVGEGGSKVNYNILNVSSADDVNLIFKETMGYVPPYKPGTTVTEIQLTENATYVRVYDKVNSRMQGGWVMKEEDIVGLTPQDIQNKFALPTTPKYICDVNLEAGTRLRTGEVNPLFGFEGGGQQYDLIINGKNVGTFTNERIIGQ